MSDFNGTARTSYFRVQPEKLSEFKGWAKKLNLEVVENADGHALLSHEAAGWPNYQPDDADMEGVDFAQQISPWLAPGEVAVLLEVGYEKMAYLHGYACAASADGELVEINLTRSIMAKAKKKWPGAHVTEPSY